MSDDGKAFWERTAKRYDLSMMLLGGPLEQMLPRVVEEVDGLGRVLELAAGTGLVTEVIAPVVRELDATDYADAMVAQLQARVGQRANVRARALDVYALDGTDRYDAVVAANVLHLLPALDSALDAMLRALSPDGRLVVPTYCHDETTLSRLTSRAMSQFGFPGRRRLTLEGLVRILTEKGLEIRRAELLPGLLPIGFVSATLRS